MYEIKDKVFLITGGAAGIGAGLTKAILKEGAKYVAVLDLDVTNGTALEKELSAIYGKDKINFFKCDVSCEDLNEAFEAVSKQFGCIDVVINNAGIMNDSPKTYKKEIEVNVTALITSSLKAFNLMRKDRGGKTGTIVNISSIAGIAQFSCVPVYCATKSAVLQFSKCLGDDIFYSKSGVRVITLCFGATDTALLHKIQSIDEDPDESILKCLFAVPLQRVESAVAGALTAIKHGSSGSTWLITSDEPAKDISDNIEKGYEIMSQGVFDKK